MSNLKLGLALLAAFTIGALACEVKNLREYADLRVQRAEEEAFWRGYNTGQEDLARGEPKILEGL